MNDDQQYGFQAREATITTRDAVRTTEADAAPPMGSGILATAQNNIGSPTVKLTPQTTVEIPGGNPRAYHSFVEGYMQAEKKAIAGYSKK